MFSFLLILFLLWLFFRLGFGFFRIAAFLFLTIIVACFFAYLLLPLLIMAAVGGLLWAVIR